MTWHSLDLRKDRIIAIKQRMGKQTLDPLMSKFPVGEPMARNQNQMQILASASQVLACFGAEGGGMMPGRRGNSGAKLRPPSLQEEGGDERKWNVVKPPGRISIRQVPSRLLGSWPQGRRPFGR